MTEPRTLTDAELLTWAVVLGYRDQRQRDGITVLLSSLPPCPDCGAKVHDARAAWVREPLREEVTIHTEPCGHVSRASLRDLERIQPHHTAMLQRLERESRTIGEIMREAQARVGEEPASPVVGHATIGINVTATGATQPADTVEAMRERILTVVAELRAQAAEHETGVDGKLPMDHPMALWCDTVTNIAYQIEYALRAPTPARGVPIEERP
ncbi:hypothetical protein [Streptomyces sp. cg35]|uniref:hypothetical protein n=1 Tax=Streptomyces sp. cg35 TaxID=3421650 RepID=UPI003D1805B8